MQLGQETETMQDKIHYRFYQPADAQAVTDLVHRVFEIAPFPAETWQSMEAQDHITVVAVVNHGKANETIIGAIPFELRDFVIRPGVTIRAAFAHMVSVDAEYRSNGVGTGILQFAKKNLPTHCEAMFVYTGGEGHAPYTFYEKNGFTDLSYNRFYTANQVTQSGSLEERGVQVFPFPSEIIRENALNRAYQEIYGSFGGFPQRYAGAWQRLLESIIYAEIPTEFQIAAIFNDGELSAYAIFGFNGGDATIHELTAREEHDLKSLVLAATDTACARGMDHVRIPASTHHPVQPHLAELGFQASERQHSIVTAAYCFQYERLWQRLCSGQPPCGLRLWTPSRQIEIPGPSPIVLEMKESTLNRLFLCREDLGCALETERITSPDLMHALNELQQIFQPAPWVFHWFEWI